MPFFLENENLIGASYLHMLVHYALPRFTLLRDYDIFQQYGAPAHFSSCVPAISNSKRPKDGLGGKPIAWLGCSNELTPCDLTWLVLIKCKIYSGPIGFMEELKTG